MENELMIKPIKIVEVELSQPITPISDESNEGKSIYQKALVLARLHSYPLGLVEIGFTNGEIDPTLLAGNIFLKFNKEINFHLHEDGLESISEIPTGGLVKGFPPRCILQRELIYKDAPLISVVIATRDRGQSLARTMDSLLDQEYPRFEIILVDNAPTTSETFDFFTQNQARFNQKNIELHYIREEVPGLAVAHNRGIVAVKGEIVAFTDDDVIVDRYWLSELLLGFRAGKNVGAVTGLVIPAELETPAQVWFEEYGGFTKGFSLQVYDRNVRRPKNEYFPFSAGRFGTGANMALRVSVLKNIGGFDPALGVGTPVRGADDLSVFFNVIMQGYQLVYQPSALVHHQHRRTYEGLQRQMFGYGTGLTAFLTKSIIDQPGIVFNLLPMIPSGLGIILSSNSAKNKNKSTYYPKELERIERRGMLIGPAAYLYSRWVYRKMRRKYRLEAKGKTIHQPESTMVGE